MIDEFGKTDVAMFEIEVEPLATGNPPRIPGVGPINAPIAGNQLSPIRPTSVGGVSPGLSLDNQVPIQGGFNGNLGAGPTPSLPSLALTGDNPLTWSLDDAATVASDSGNPVFTIKLDGEMSPGQNVSVHVAVGEQFDNVDQQLLAEAIAEAVNDYDGPGELAFDGKNTLSFTSPDGTLMDPLDVTMPVPTGSPDEMLNLHSSENSEINENDDRDADQSDDENSEPSSTENRGAQILSLIHI